MAAANAFEHTLAIDPENETAHHNLAELFAILGGTSDAPAETEAAADEVVPERIAPSDLNALAAALAKPDSAAAPRIAAAERLTRLIPRFLAIDRDPFESRHSVLVELLDRASPAYSSASDATLAQAIARLLHVLHRELHQMYKADDNAREAVTVHRQKNAPANHAAQSIVIYPLNRPDAPGLTGRSDLPDGLARTRDVGAQSAPYFDSKPDAEP
jgi:hypothetical protein